jgi:hypothetical protein
MFKKFTQEWRKRFDDSAPVIYTASILTPHDSLHTTRANELSGEMIVIRPRFNDLLASHLSLKPEPARGEMLYNHLMHTILVESAGARVHFLNTSDLNYCPSSF